MLRPLVRLRLPALLLALATVAAAIWAGGATGQPAAGGAPQARAAAAAKVTICHRVGGPSYVRITVAQQAALNGHAKNHDLDIIPPFAGFAGQNWDEEGRQIWENGCAYRQVPQVTPQPQPQPQPDILQPPLPPEVPITPQVTCVQLDYVNETYSAVFGYASENTVERAIPVGAANLLSPGAADRGQPTSFSPGLLRQAFKVTAIPFGDTLTWSLTFGGATRTATATKDIAAQCGPPVLPQPQPQPQPPKAAAADWGIFLSCVDVRPDGAQLAHFGYVNDTSYPISVPLGVDNRFAPAPESRGQVTTLQPGRVEDAFSVLIGPAGERIGWQVTVEGETKAAFADARTAPRCPTTTPPPLEQVAGGVSATCIHVNADGTYDVQFGYTNPGTSTLEVPIGYANRVSPSPADRGQPILFSPGTVDDAFVVRDVPADVRASWTVSFGSGTVTAYADRWFAQRCPEPFTPGPNPRPEPDPKPRPQPDPLREPEPIPTPITLQTIGVSVNCVVNHADGTYDALFGYQNPNDEVVSIAAGADNRLSAGDLNGTPPTTFQTGLFPVAFRVSGIPAGRELTWTVRTAPTRSSSATASAGFETKCLKPSGVNAARLTIRKTSARAAVAPGGRLGYRIAVSNAGNLASNAVRVEDQLPAGVKPERALTAGGSCRISGQTVYCRLDPVSPGATVSIYLGVRLQCEASCPTRVRNRAVLRIPGARVGRTSTVYVPVARPQPQILTG